MKNKPDDGWNLITVQGPNAPEITTLLYTLTEGMIRRCDSEITQFQIIIPKVCKKCKRPL